MLVYPGVTAVDRVLCFATVVLVPIGLAVTDTPSRSGNNSGLYQLLVFTQPLSGLATLVSVSVATGQLAGFLALPWLLTSSVACLIGCCRLLSKPHLLAEEVSLDAGFIFLVVGGTWFTAARFDWNVLGFSDEIATLTAIHFHYAGFVSLIIAGLTGRRLANTALKTKTYHLTIIFLISGVPLVALGITLWRFGYFFPSLLATLILAIGMWLLAWTIYFGVAPLTEKRIVRVLLVLSAVAGSVAMGLAIVYSTGLALGATYLTIPTMIRSHGLLQAFGFAGGALMAYALESPAPPLWRPGIPFSKLRARFFVGAEFFSRSRLIQEQKTKPTGIVDDLRVFRRQGFDPTLVNPRVRDFYENTAQYRLLVRPQWQKGFRSIGGLLRKIGSGVGQMRFPIEPERNHDTIASQIVPLNDNADGRQNVRGWIRTYEPTHEAMYVAAYSVHSFRDRSFMNIAFPLPAGNLTSILDLTWLNVSTGDGLLLTSFQHDSAHIGDQGVYLASAFCAVRLPINETIQVWSREQAPADVIRDFPPGATVFGRHDMWIFGLKFLILDYAIYPIA